jgi:hypothetical protein
MKTKICMAALLLFLNGVLFLTAQEVVLEASELQFEDMRNYYVDIAGFHGIGSAESIDKEESLRLAKASGINNIFVEIEKDALFQEMFISSWPEAIKVTEAKLFKSLESYKAIVRVSIDQNSVALTEQNYQVTALNLLNRAETILDKIEDDLEQARTMEENLQLAEALTLYQQAKSRSREIQSLFNKLTANSVLSDEGNNRSAIVQSSEALSASIESGLDRMALAESRVETDANTKQMEQTFNLLRTELSKIDDAVAKYSPMAPFYDLPRSNLDAALLELSSAIDKLSLITEKMITLQAGVLPEQKLLQEKIAFSMTDAEHYDERLQSMILDIEEEIRYPRLKKQDDARKKAERIRFLKRSLQWTFLHVSNDVFTFRYELPFEIDISEGFNNTNNLNTEFRLERTFPTGIWMTTTLKSNSVDLTQDIVNRSLSQEAAIGFYKKILFGFGFGWDWNREVSTNDGNYSADRQKMIKIIFGGINKERMRSDFLLSIAYNIPTISGEFIVPYHFNTDIDIRLRVEDAVILEAGVFSGCFFDSEGDSADDLYYVSDLQVGVGFRLPKPFTWGVRYRRRAGAPVEDGSAQGIKPIGSGWSAYFEYSL